MPPLKFDRTLGFDDHAVQAQGPLALDRGESVLVICVKIYQDETLLAECDPGRHPFTASGGRWVMDAEYLPGAVPQQKGAIATAVAVTSGPGGAMSTYTWTQPVDELQPLAGGHPHA